MPVSGRPQVAPKFTTVCDITVYYSKKIKDLIPLWFEIRKELTSEVNPHCCKYLSELSQEHIIKKDKYFNEKINIYKQIITAIDYYIIQQKVKGQLREAKSAIKSLNEQIECDESTRDNWGIPT